MRADRLIGCAVPRFGPHGATRCLGGIAAGKGREPPAGAHYSGAPLRWAYAQNAGAAATREHGHSELVELQGPMRARASEVRTRTPWTGATCLSNVAQRSHARKIAVIRRRTSRHAAPAQTRMSWPGQPAPPNTSACCRSPQHLTEAAGFHSHLIAGRHPDARSHR
jgi:hypothetical protein